MNGNPQWVAQLTAIFTALMRRRLKILVLICTVLFCINVYLILSYFQLTEDVKINIPASADGNGSELSKQTGEMSSQRKPRCEFSGPLALSAFNRMKSETCKMMLEGIICDMKSGGWPVDYIEQTCPMFEKSNYMLKHGCFADSIKSRLLTAFKFDLPERNTPEVCVQHCLRAGFQLAGVQYKNECFCGYDKNIVDVPQHVDPTQCEQYQCPGNMNEYCGGFNAITVYSTGVLQNNKSTPKYVNVTEEADRNVKILFLLQLNGRNSRQIRRLLKILYHPRHLYYIHVDMRQEFMKQEMMDIQTLLEAQNYHNFRVAQKQFPTIWGGASLLEMFLSVVNETLNDQKFSNWDYIINMSETDFPVLSLSELETIMAANKGKSFVSSHGYNTGTFLKKQGYNFQFMQCENRMWRFGARENYPYYLRVDGGSDWVAIHSDLARFGVSNEEFPVQLRLFFSSVLLPLEGFFHTLLLNTKFCNSVLYNNLRYTNWKRSQGCRCAALKHVVDWCGCSPIAILHDERKVDLDRVIEKVQYFARKFDPLIDIDSVAKAEQQALRFAPHKIQRQSSVFNSTWVNFFDYRFDNDFLYGYLANALFDYLKLECSFDRLEQIHAYTSELGAQQKLLFLIRDKCGRQTEILTRRMDSGVVEQLSLTDYYKLDAIEFGRNLDLKDEIFRDFVSLIHRNESVTFQLSWTEMEKPKKSRNTTSPSVWAALYSPDGTFIRKDKLKAYDSINGNNHVSVDLKEIKNLSSGIHKVIFTPAKSTGKIGHLFLPVFPAELSEEFRILALRFYEIQSSCTASGSENECKSTLWSSLYPDLKTQISFGFNEATGSLV